MATVITCELYRCW